MALEPLVTLAALIVSYRMRPENPPISQNERRNSRICYRTESGRTLLAARD